MGVFIYPPERQHQFALALEYTPRTLRGGMGPPPMNLDCLFVLASQANTRFVYLDLLGFLPGTSINQNSIQINVQPIPLGTYMPFIIAPTVTVVNPNYITLEFSVGNLPGEVVGTLHQVFVNAADIQAQIGSFQFYYYKTA